MWPATVVRSTPSEEVFNRSFKARTVVMRKRKIFLLKSYGITLLFIILSHVQIMPILLTPKTHTFFRQRPLIYLASSFVYILSVLILNIFPWMKISVYYYAVLVAILAECEAILALHLAIDYGLKSLLIAIAIVIGIFGAITLLALFFPFDITRYLFYVAIFTLLSVCVAFGLRIYDVFYHNLLIDLIFKVILDIVVFIYLYAQSQAILGGNWMQLDERDYMMAAIILFTNFMGVTNAFLDLEYDTVIN